MCRPHREQAHSHNDLRNATNPNPYEEPVGAAVRRFDLPAKAALQAAEILNVPAPSRADSLLQVSGGIALQNRNEACAFRPVIRQGRC